jgi:hypothetical protein
VISVTAGGQTRAYPLRILNHHEIVPSVNLYWFAWQAFHPHTLLWTPQTESTEML